MGLIDNEVDEPDESIEAPELELVEMPRGPEALYPLLGLAVIAAIYLVMEELR